MSNIISEAFILNEGFIRKLNDKIKKCKIIYRTYLDLDVEIRSNLELYILDLENICNIINKYGKEQYGKVRFNILRKSN